MSPQPERPFSISDAVILVAAAAVGMILVRSYLPGFVRHISTLDRQIRPIRGGSGSPMVGFSPGGVFGNPLHGRSGGDAVAAASVLRDAAQLQPTPDSVACVSRP